MKEIKIKFRAWDKENNKMLSHNDLDCMDRDGIMHLFDIIKNPEKEGVILNQFTGLKDKNWIDIYEGDILEYKTELGRHNLHKVFRHVGGLVINSHKDDFYKEEFTPFYEACADNQTYQYIEQCEVIGNIYENKELTLKQ